MANHCMVRLSPFQVKELENKIKNLVATKFETMMYHNTFKLNTQERQMPVSTWID